MVRAKRVTRSSNKARKENEASENALGQSNTCDLTQVDVEPDNAAVPYEDEIEKSLDQAESGKDEETHNLEMKNAVMVDNDENEIMTEMDDNNSDEEDLNSSEDDELHSEESLGEDGDENFEDVNEEDTVDKDDNIVELQTGEDESKDHVEMEGGVEKNENVEEVQQITNGDAGNSQEPVTEKVKESLKEDVDKSTRNRKKVQPASSKELKSADDHKPESSRKRKAKERVESMGMIFMCSSTTKEDCFRYRVLGLPASKKDTVEKIYPGMRLFLYDVDLKLLNGIYKAAGPGGYNIEPKAFKSQFPSQVRFRVLKDCLPLAEEKFKKVIKDNYFSKNKFDCKLNSVQVNKLCKLFLAKSRGQRLVKSGRSRKAENRTTVHRGGLRIRRAEGAQLHSVREERRYHDRSHKRQRRVPVSPLQEPLPLRVPAPRPSSVRLYPHDRTSGEDPYRKYPYLEICDPYRDAPLLTHGDPYTDRRDPPIERGSYRDGREPPIERQMGENVVTFYGVRRDPPLERHDPYRDGRQVQLERPSPYRDGQRAYIVHHDPYSERRDSYLVHHSPPRAIPQIVPYIAYSRDPLPDNLDVYRDDRLVETRDSNGRKLLLDHRDRQPHIEQKRLNDISSRDSYVPYQARPAYMEPTYSAEYPSQARLEGDLRKIESADHFNRDALSGYFSRRA
ncbi:hypothetical protein F511_17555 [Dorcoceras hygrometricum]|uniref:DCD domain-containing protein n=1 Tax=Dorcoceras hygrometricum TaxID=472368 RepID=A0A2Z7B762_9LAMI|nr:hypothetical protein F511_17555 [Dorcoceras hygrometricum]